MSLQRVDAQQLNREEVISAYMFNFAKNIEWPMEERRPAFHFLVISDDKGINLEMSQLSASQKLKGKPIRVTISESVVIPKDIQLIFITRGLKDLTEPVFRRIEGRNTLLITDGFDDKRFVMINLIETKDKTIRFEINKANILNQGLNVLPDMVLLGGTDIDVAKLYKQSQDTLHIKEAKISGLKRQLDSLNVQIEISHKEIGKQDILIARKNQDILEQQKQLENQQKQLENQQKQLENQQRQMENQRVQMDKQRDTLSRQTDLLHKSQNALRLQMKEIERGRAFLSDQQKKIDRQNAIFLRQEKQLDEQNLIIAVQKNIQRFLILTIVLFSGLSYTLFRSYKSKQAANRQLQEQKEKLRESLGELKLAKDKAQLYLDIAGVILVALDTEGRITMINRKGCDVLGNSVDEAIGRSWFATFIPEGIRPDLLRNFHQIIDGNMHSAEYYENPVSTREHGERLIAWHNALLRDENGTVVGTLSSGEDITEKRSAEKKIKKLNQDLLARAAALETANKELEAFSYSVSHDLRAPLRSIDGFSQAILEDYEQKIDEPGREYLRRVRSAAQHMAQLIDDLLKLSRVARNEMVLQEVNLSSMAFEIAEKIRMLQADRNVTLNIQPGMLVWGDENLLRIALENLFDNAWKYTSKHPSARIEFGSRTLGRKRIFFVKDDGAGFDMRYARKLFGAFQRMHSAGEFPGTGIGLATVQRIILRHGGEIWAESEVEKGTTFSFSLPEKEAWSDEL